MASFFVECAARWSQHPWMGEAMRAEFHAAQEDGRELSFALGCLWASLAALPSERRGAAIAIRLLVGLVLALPFAILEINGVRLGVQFLATGQNHYYASLLHGDEAQQALAAVYRQATPLITFLLTIMGLSQLALIGLMAWGRHDIAARVAQCAVATGLVMAAIILRITADNVALAIYVGVPAVQWCLVRWMTTQTTA
jgi:hypothetical protein